MLNEIRIPIDVTGRDIGMRDQVKFPQPVVARDPAGFAEPRFRQMDQGGLRQGIRLNVILVPGMGQKPGKLRIGPAAVFQEKLTRNRTVRDRLPHGFENLISRAKQVLTPHPALQTRVIEQPGDNAAGRAEEHADEKQGSGA